METESINKAGESWLVFSTFPSKEGLRVQVKAHPEVEDFFRTISQGQTQNVLVHGNYWTPPNPEQPFLVYRMDRDIEVPGYDLSSVGRSLGSGQPPPPAPQIERERQVGIRPPAPYGSSEWCVNLSFLRLVGISQGIEFGVRDVFSLDFRRKLKQAVGDAFRKFHRDHFKHVKVTLVMNSQEF